MVAPKWATDLAARVCEDAGAPPIDLVWRRKRNGGDWVRSRDMGPMPYQYSTGRTWPDYERYAVDGPTPVLLARGRVVVTAGGTRSEQALCLLHEIAHALVGPGHGHDAAFWAQAWKLYRQYGLASYALKREPGYRKLALEVAAREGVRGAKALQRRKGKSR